jgi:hypothetical protein
MNNSSNIYNEPPKKVRVKSRRRSKPNSHLFAIKWFSISFGIFLPFVVAAAWPTTRSVKAPPTDQQLDQVVMAIQSLATHREPVVRGREILKGFLYRWGNQ